MIKHLLSLFKHNFNLIIVIFSITFHVIGYGFAAGTWVQTACGYQAIEQLQINDTILCFDDNHQLVEERIVCTFPHNIPSYIQLIIGNECISLSPHHKLYLANTKQWIRAKDLRPGNILVQQYDDYCLIEAVKHIQQSIQVYELTVANHHNFCVSHLDIKVHNVIPFVVLGFGWAFGLGAIEFSGITFSIFAAGWGISAAIKHQKKKPSVEVTLIPNCSSSPPDPNERNRKKNTISKSEFFNKNEIKKNYYHWRNGIYKRQKGTNGIENAEYIQWDHLHNDIEAYNAAERHLGSIDPASLKIYKDPIVARKLPK